MTLRERAHLGLRRLRPALPALAIGMALALLPAPTCLLRLALGIPCPACGLTRAALALSRLDWASARRFHPLAPELVLLALFTAVLAFHATDALWRRVIPLITGGAGLALVAVWLLRFAGLFQGPVPP